MERKIKITIEYDGTNYYGWQVQPDQISVQEKIEDALEILFNKPIKIHGAGRTDAGVDARGQVAHFMLDADIPAERIMLAINTKLPKDIRIKESKEVNEEFHARYSAKGKIYQYTIYNGHVPSAINRNSSYHVKDKLDIDKMKAACEHFIGQHDFSAFCVASSDVKDKVRKIERIDFVTYGNYIEMEFEGNGFLYNMIRIMAGTIIDVGKGRVKGREIANIIESKDRARASATAGANGLCLIKVKY